MTCRRKRALKAIYSGVKSGCLLPTTAQPHKMNSITIPAFTITPMPLPNHWLARVPGTRTPASMAGRAETKDHMKFPNVKMVDSAEAGALVSPGQL